MQSDLPDWRDEFELVLNNGKLAAGSAKQYLTGIDQFIAWMADNHPAANAEDLSDRHVNEWLGHLAHRPDHPLKATTRRLRLIAVKVWGGYLVRQDDCPLTINPAAGISLPEPDEDPVPVIPDEDLAAIIATCSGTKFAALRDRVILRLMVETGGRRGELSAMNLDDIDLKGQETKLDGKTGKRLAPYGGKTALALTKYLRARSRHPGAEDPALLLSNRCTGGSWRLGGEAIWHMLKRRAERAGITYHVRPHMVRHTWAHDMKDNGVSDENLEILAGWRPGSKSGRRYGHSVAQERARKAARSLARGDRV
jgi:site-specific recombinase XerD